MTTPLWSLEQPNRFVETVSAPYVASPRKAGLRLTAALAASQSPQAVSTPLTPDDARRLASVLPLSASEWLELDRNYRSSVTRLAYSCLETAAQSLHKQISPSVANPLH